MAHFYKIAGSAVGAGNKDIVVTYICMFRKNLANQFSQATLGAIAHNGSPYAAAGCKANSYYTVQGSRVVCNLQYKSRHHIFVTPG